MIIATDEILNRYVDGELNKFESAQVLEAINSSDDVKRRFEVLKLVHKNLEHLELNEVDDSFTEKIMTRLLVKSVVPRQQQMFFISIVVFITLISLLVLGYVVGEILSSMPASTESVSTVDTLNKLSDGLILFVKEIFSGQSLSIIGAIFSFLIIISGYFFFEHQKKTKANFSSL
jgi:hypothetical protein